MRAWNQLLRKRAEARAWRSRLSVRSASPGVVCWPNSALAGSRARSLSGAVAGVASDASIARGVGASGAGATGE